MARAVSFSASTMSPDGSAQDESSELAAAPQPSDLLPMLERSREILVLRVDEIGDVVLTTPFLRELRRNAPAARITLVVKPGLESLVRTCPHVDEVLSYDWLHRRSFIRPDRYARVLQFWWNHLRKRSFDLALVPRRDRDYYSAKLLAYLSGARWRVGYDPSGPSEPVLTPGGHPFFTHVVRDRTPRHEAESALNMLRALGGEVESSLLEVHPTPADERVVDEALRDAGARGPFLCLAIGAGARRRRWPLERFRAVSAWIHQQLGATVILVGGPADALEASTLARQQACGVVNLAGRLSLRQTAALLGRCRMFLGNDSGPMHLAVAAGIPVVEVSCHPLNAPLDHANSPARFGPWGVPAAILRPVTHRWPCRGGCRTRWAHCILGVSVSEVQRAVGELWPTTVVT